MLFVASEAAFKDVAIRFACQKYGVSYDLIASIWPIKFCSNAAFLRYIAGY